MHKVEHNPKTSCQLCENPHSLRFCVYYDDPGDGEPETIYADICDSCLIAIRDGMSWRTDSDYRRYKNELQKKYEKKNKEIRLRCRAAEKALQKITGVR